MKKKKEKRKNITKNIQSPAAYDFFTPSTNVTLGTKTSNLEVKIEKRSNTYPTPERSNITQQNIFGILSQLDLENKLPRIKISRPTITTALATTSSIIHHQEETCTPFLITASQMNCPSNNYTTPPIPKTNLLKKKLLRTQNHCPPPV